MKEEAVDRMKPDSEIARFLLNELAAEEREAMEERMFADTALFEQVEAAQQELIDGYLDGLLAPERRERFEAVFRATPELWSRVEFSKQLRERLRSEAPAPRHVAGPVRASWFSRLFQGWVPALAASAAGVLLLMAGSGWISARRDLDASRREVAGLRQSNADLERKIAEGLAPRPAAQVPQPVQKLVELVYSFAVSPGQTRGAGDARPLMLPRNAGAAMLQLELDAPGAYPRYRAVLETGEGRELTRQDGLVAAGGALAFQVAADKLPGGDYVVRVSGVRAGSVESVADYSIRVVRR